MAGDTNILSLSTKLYPLDMIYATAYIYLDTHYFKFDGTPEHVEVHITPKQTTISSTFQKDFLNQLIVTTNYFNQLEKNRDIVNAVLQRALFSANPKLVEQAEDQELQSILAEVENDIKQDAKEHNHL